jgi:hypothetical protein
MLTRRQIAAAKLQAEVIAANNDSSLMDQLNLKAQELGYSSWSDLINIFRRKHNDTGLQRPHGC